MFEQHTRTNIFLNGDSAKMIFQVLSAAHVACCRMGFNPSAFRLVQRLA